MTVQSATAHTRRARGRLSVRPPAVRTSASRARDWHTEKERERGAPTLARNTSANQHVHSSSPGLLPDIRGQTAVLKHFNIYTVVTAV